MRSLNEIYEEKRLVYYCNACGDINIPNTAPLSFHEAEELPIKERNLYLNYWNDDSGCQMYVVNYDGESAMALGWLFDSGYCDDLSTKTPALNRDMERLWLLVKDYARLLSFAPTLAGCEILAGKNTDPDGHEILAIIPYRMRDKIQEIAHDLADKVYSDIEALV